MFVSSHNPRDLMLPALLPSGAPVPVMSDSTQDRLNVSHSERDFSVANNLKLDLSSWTDAGTFHLPLHQLQYHPGYKNLEIWPKSLGVMCGPPPFGELRVLTPRIRFAFFGAPRVLTTTKFFGLGHAEPQIFRNRKRGRLFSSSLKSPTLPQITDLNVWMGGSLTDVGRWTHDGKWTVIPENAASTVEFIAELNASIAGFAELLNHPPTCRGP